MEELVIADKLPPTVDDISQGYIKSGLATFQAYESFDVGGGEPEFIEAANNRAQQKDLFLSGEIANPVLNDCPRLYIEASKRAEMYRAGMSLIYAQQLRRENGSPRTIEDGLLEAVIDQRISELAYVDTAAILEDKKIDEFHRYQLTDRLKKQGRELYGMPDKNHALTVVDRSLKKAEVMATSDDLQASKIARDLLYRVYLPQDFDAVEQPELNSEQLAYYKVLLREGCQKAAENAVNTVGPKDIYSAEEMVEIFTQYLVERKYSDAGWTVNLINNRTMCAANQASKTVLIGTERPAKARSLKRVMQSMIHELEVHVGRQVRGEKLGNGLAGYALASTVAFEEALAGTFEDLYFGDVRQRGELPMLSIALSAGYDGEERDFHESHETLWPLLYVRNYKLGDDNEPKVLSSRLSAYSQLQRIWRGMPTYFPGCIFPKDNAYNNSGLIDYLYNGGRLLPRKDFLRLLQAKYDPRNSDQDQYIRCLTSTN
jgi:hypothetical protein